MTNFLMAYHLSCVIIVRKCGMVQEDFHILNVNPEITHVWIITTKYTNPAEGILDF